MRCTKIEFAGRKAALLSGALLVGATPMAAAAQETGAPDADKGAIEEIVVTAGKRQEALSEVGEGISALSGSQLEKLNASTMQDYLARIPGLSLQSGGTPGFGNISVRGISPQSVGATTAIYIDEIPASPSSSLTQGGYFGQDFDPSDLERLELLKGPQGTIYGASSMGGVLKFVTRQPNLLRTEVNLSQDLSVVEDGDIGYKLSGAASTPLIEDKLAVRVSGFYRSIPGYIDDVGLGGRDANDGEAWGLRTALLFKPTDTLAIKVTGMTQSSRSNARNFVDYAYTTGKPAFGDLTHRRYVPETFDTDSHLVAAEVNWEIGPGTLTSATGYSEYDTDLVTDFTNYGSIYNRSFGLHVSPATPIGFQQRDRVEKFSQELRYTSRRIGALEFIVGGFYQHENLDETVHGYYYFTDGNVNFAEGRVRDTHRGGKLDEYAGFANATFYVGEQFDITGGYRHSRIEQSRFSVATGIFNNPSNPAIVTRSNQDFAEGADTYLIGARWRPTNDLLFYARAASGYRPGGGRTVPVGAPADFANFYTSDSLWSYEAGVKFQGLDGRLSIDADGFWIDWSNIQTFVQVGPFFTDGNGGAARSRGVEFKADFVPVRGVSLGATAAYTDSKFTEGNPANGIVKGDRLYFIPEWTASAYGSYSVPVSARWNADIGGDVQYFSSRLDSGRRTYPGFSQLNLNAGISDARFSINFYVKNLTDKRGFTGGTGAPASASPVFSYAIIQPRTFGVALRERF